MRLCDECAGRAVLFRYDVPGESKYEINAFTFPIEEADIEASNEYIAQCVRSQAVRSGFPMCIKPEYSVGMWRNAGSTIFPA